MKIRPLTPAAEPCRACRDLPALPSLRDWACAVCGRTAREAKADRGARLLENVEMFPASDAQDKAGAAAAIGDLRRAIHGEHTRPLVIFPPPE